MARAKQVTTPRREEDGTLVYDAHLVVNGRVVVSTAPQGYRRRHRAREMLRDVLSGKYADAEVVDQGAAALDQS